MWRSRLSDPARLVVATVAVVVISSAAAAVALTGTAAPAPRIVAHPARHTRRTTAVFRFRDRRRPLRFVCSLNGSRYRRCRSPIRYRARAGHNTFAVKAIFRSGVVSRRASYRWTVIPPVRSLSIAFPLAARYYNAAGWRSGCTAGSAACGRVLRLRGSETVAVTLRQNSTGRYFNGRAFRSRSAVYLRARLGHARIGRPARWTARLALPRPDGAYTLRVRATATRRIRPAHRRPRYLVATGKQHRRRGRVIRVRLTQTVAFTIDTIVPPVPRLETGPPARTTSTSARPSFGDAEPGVAFECELDAHGWQPCASPAYYYGLAVGQHTFLVRAVDRAGNISAPAGLSWRVLSPVTGPSTGMPFTITGTIASPLYPGATAQPLALTLTNPNSVAIVVTTVTVTVASTPADCPASNFVVAQTSLPAAGLALPARGSVTLPADGVAEPTLQMLDTGTNQDACQGASLGLSYSGSAHS